VTVGKNTIAGYSESRKTHQAHLYKYFLIEYYCLIYSDGDSLKNKLKCRARLARNLLKSLKREPVFQ
jgi:hypothetical protein